ncbi:MAG: restriction endonuclease subunit S [Lentimicrobium sp.]|jgi:type I restriction enzyme S subunit|nr:restriction endonuclease subunit S [Lentimicrobium sp.]
MITETNSLAKFGILDVPDGWQIKKLKDILIEGRLGGNYENAEANNGIPVIKMGNLDRATIKIDKIQYLPENEIYNDEDVLVKGDLLFNTRNTLELVGKVAIWNNELPFAVYNSNLMRMKFDSSFVESTWFMNRAFNSYYGLRQLRGIATGTTSVAAIYGRDLESIKFLLPPLPEQKAIARVLSMADAAIHTTEKLIAQKELRKKWLMQNLLTGKMRLKGFGGEWKEHSYKKILKVVKRNFDWNENELYKLISVRRRSGGIFYREALFGHQILVKNLRTANEGDFLFSKMQILHGASALVTKEFDGAKISGSYIAVVPKDNNMLNMEFFQWYSQTPYFYHQTYISSYGVHIEKMTFDFDTFLQLEMKLPSIEEQTTIAQVLQVADKEISLLKAKAEKLRELKKGVMQVLLTGKVRLNTNNFKIIENE